MFSGSSLEERDDGWEVKESEEVEGERSDGLRTWSGMACGVPCCECANGDCAAWGFPDPRTRPLPKVLEDEAMSEAVAASFSSSSLETLTKGQCSACHKQCMALCLAARGTAQVIAAAAITVPRISYRLLLIVRSTSNDVAKLLLTFVT